MIKKIQIALRPTKSFSLGLLFALSAVTSSVYAQASASTAVSDLHMELIDLNNSDSIAPGLERVNIGTRGMSLSATNWANYQAPTQFTQTVTSLFSPGAASIANADAAASLSINGSFFSQAGVTIQTEAVAYGAPADGFVLGTRVISVQDNLGSPTQGLRVTPYTKLILSGELSFFGSITATPYPYTQQASSLVLISFGRPGVVPVSFSKGVAVELPGDIGGPAASYSQIQPFSLAFENATPEYVDNLVFQLTVQSFAKTNLISAVPELSIGTMFLIALGLLALRMRGGRLWSSSLAG